MPAFISLIKVFEVIQGMLQEDNIFKSTNLMQIIFQAQKLQSCLGIP